MTIEMLICLVNSLRASLASWSQSKNLWMGEVESWLAAVIIGATSKSKSRSIECWIGSFQLRASAGHESRLLKRERSTSAAQRRRKQLKKNFFPLNLFQPKSLISRQYRLSPALCWHLLEAKWVCIGSASWQCVSALIKMVHLVRSLACHLDQLSSHITCLVLLEQKQAWASNVGQTHFMSCQPNVTVAASKCYQVSLGRPLQDTRANSTSKWLNFDILRRANSGELKREW